jgi:hypothetical protein
VDHEARTAPQAPFGSPLSCHQQCRRGEHDLSRAADARRRSGGRRPGNAHAKCARNRPEPTANAPPSAASIKIPFSTIRGPVASAMSMSARACAPWALHGRSLQS